jgi:1,2-beta-oligoglucan phosphorylase
MERGIVSGIFTPEQAASHLELICRHLTGPDGARLMDRPLKYSGGIEKIFRRAESSTFFGREIGLMYVHEHIRYAEVTCAHRPGRRVHEGLAAGNSRRVCVTRYPTVI